MTRIAKTRILFSSIALLLGAPVHADHIKVVLLGGQSNMQGNNALLSQLPPNLQPPQDDVLLYSGTNSAAFFGSLQVGAGNNFGPEISFGRAVADGRPYDRFCLIKFAQGATSLHTNWDPATGSVYTEFRTTVTYGLDALTKAGHTYEIVGMCWTQGENDVQDFRTTAQYEADLNEFIADIRTRYGAGVKFFISRLSDNQTWRPASQVNEIRTAQDNVAAADPLSYLIDTDGFDMRSDNLHFEETGYVDVGEAFAASYLSATNDATAPTLDTLSPAHTDSGVDPTANLSITFTEDITFGTGAIRLMQTGGTPVESFDVASPPATLTLSGATLTINPTALLSPTTGYYVEIDATAIDDLAGNSYIGISGDGTWSFTTSAADTTPPGIASLSPAHSATGVLFNTNLRITFSENIAFGTGEIRLRQAGGALVQSFDVASAPAGLTLSGTTLTINPSVDLAAATGYYVEIDATAIDDHAGESFPGFMNDGTWSFTTAPALISGSKITATASVHSGSTTAMPFMTIDGSGLSGGVHGTAASTKWNTPTVSVTNQWIQWDLGASYTLDSIHVWNYKDQFVSSIKSVDIYYSNAPIPGDPEGVGAGNWTKLGGASVQLPEAPDSPNTGFDLETATSTTLPETEVRFIRFELNTNWQESTSYRTGLAEIQFTAKPGGPDLTEPGVSSLSPTHTATGVALASNLSITFTENVAFGTGAIRLRRQSDDSVIQSFDVASPPAGLTLSGDTVTLNPTADLSQSTTYYVEIDDTAIDDLVGNSFSGFSGDGTWRFTSVSADTTLPTINSLTPAHTATGISYSSNLVINFSENVAFGTGEIRLLQSGGALIESFDVASPPTGLTLSGSSVTLNPTADLAPATTYYVEIDATAIDDLVGNSFAGFINDGTWRFTTFVPDETLPTISTLNPVNSATGVPVGANLVITFSENIAFDTGEIRLLKSGGGAPIDSFDVATAPSGLTLSGATVTLNPSSDLALATTYYVEIDATAIDDLAGNSFAGFNGNGTWSFTTSNSNTTAAIVLVGTQYNLETKNNDPTVGWRNATTAKTLDIDGDNIVGTDGYRTSNRVSNPAYATATVVAPNTNNFSQIDDPNNPTGNDITTGTLHDSNAGLGVESVPLLQFVITGAIPVGETLRVGVLIDGVGSANGTNSATYTLKQTVGGSATATTPALFYQDGALDVTYFDLTGFSVGDTFVVTSKTTATNTEFSNAFEQVIGITFDTGVITPPGETFADWIGGFSGLGGLTAFDDDADGDGIDSGVEAFFGTAPNAPNAGLSAVAFSGSSLTFIHPEADPPLTDVTGSYEWSLDLSAWNVSGDDVGGTIVTIGAVQDTPESGTTTVTANITGTQPGKVFVRAVATKN